MVFMTTKFLNPTSRKTLVWPLILPLLLLTMWLGTQGLDADPIWIDERYSLRDSGLIDDDNPSTILEIWDRVSSGNPWHAPGFFILLSGWGRLVGNDPFVLRAFSLLAGIVAVAWTYRLGCEAASAKVGLYAAVILGTSTYYVYYLHEIRMYSLMVLLTVAMLWAYLHLKSKVVLRRHVIIILVVTAVSLPYIHYFGLIPLAGLGVYHLFFARHFRSSRPHLWLAVLVSMLVAGLLFLPWVATLTRGMAATAEDEALNALALASGDAISTVVNLFSNGNLILFVVAVALAVLNQRPQIKAILVILSVCLLSIVAANVLLELLKPSRLRYTLFVWPLFALIVAFGITRLNRFRLISPLLLAIWCVVALAGPAVPAFLDGIGGGEVRYRYPIQDVAYWLRPRVQANDYVLNYLPPDVSDERYTFMLDYYFDDLPGSFHNFYQYYDLPADQQVVHNVILQSMIDLERVWLAHMPDYVPDSIIQFEDMLEDTYGMCAAVMTEHGANIALYTRSPVCCIPDTALAQPAQQFGDWFTVVGSGVYDSLEGSAVDVMIAWQVSPGAPLHMYSATVQLYDAEGLPVAQADYGIEPSNFQCRRMVLNVGNLQPGTYEARLAVYNWQTGVRLPASDLVTGATGDQLLLTTLTIER